MISNDKRGIPGCIVILCLLSFLHACRNERKTPDYFLPKEKLSAFLLDIHMAEGFVRINKIPPLLGDTDTALYNAIYRKHRVTPEQLDCTIIWYARNHPEEMEKLYEDMLEKLSELESDLKK